MRLTQYNLSTKEYDDIEKFDNLDPIVNKLGQHEDIEDTLRVDFLTLQKACANGFYSKYFDRIVYPLRLVIYEKHTRPHFEVVYDGSKIKLIFVDDFSRTWALTKEALK